MSTFFYDSYAFIEYFRGNIDFKSYFEEHTGITTIFNIAEIYYSVLHEKGKGIADDILTTLWSQVVDIDRPVLQKAMVFRFLHQKKKLSYADCIGYETACSRNILFLTGDMQFKDLPQVEFVK